MSPISTYTEERRNESESLLRKSPRLFSTAKRPSLHRFEQICSQKAEPSAYPLAHAIEKNIPVYKIPELEGSSHAALSELQDEWYHILLRGPGVFILRAMYPDTEILEAANTAFDRIIAREKVRAKGDHFAAGGKNDRIWNSFQKHGMEDPASFVKYYSNPWLALVCDAWLGPAYRITAQVNIVNPGGAAQVSHRDYHLGFQTAEDCANFPAAMQVASQLLTLQGGVAHTDMPLESGPTRFLPFSQTFEEGFMA